MVRRKGSEHDSRILLGMLKVLSENLVKARKVKQLTQLQLAASARVAISTISEIESKRVADVRLSTITALAEVLGIEDPLKLFKKSQ